MEPLSKDTVSTLQVSWKPLTNEKLEGMTRAEAKQYDTFVIGIFKSGEENFSLVGYAMIEVLALLLFSEKWW